MIKLSLKYIVCLLAIVVGSLHSKADVKVTASLDSASIMMGRIDTLRIIVDRDADRQGAFPLFSKSAGGSFVTLLGDTVEIGAPRIDTLKREGSRITERLVMPVQVFDSGRYVIPPFVYITADDSVASNSVELEVVPVKVGENDAIADFKDISDPSDRSFWDWMPDWLYDWWWAFVLIVVLVAAGVYYALKYKKTGKFISLPQARNQALDYCPGSP